MAIKRMSDIESEYNDLSSRAAATISNTKKLSITYNKLGDICE